MAAAAEQHKKEMEAKQRQVTLTHTRTHTFLPPPFSVLLFVLPGVLPSCVVQRAHTPSTC
eukprot:1731312-Rhodomonas_salina.1